METFLKVSTFFLPFFDKMLVARKGKLANRTLKEKCNALKELEKGQSNAAKYYVPKTPQHGLKIKTNFLQLSKTETIERDKSFVK